MNVQFQICSRPVKYFMIKVAITPIATPAVMGMTQTTSMRAKFALFLELLVEAIAYTPLERFFVRNFVQDKADYLGVSFLQHVLRVRDIRD